MHCKRRPGPWCWAFALSHSVTGFAPRSAATPFEPVSEKEVLCELPSRSQVESAKSVAVTSLIDAVKGDSGRSLALARLWHQQAVATHNARFDGYASRVLDGLLQSHASPDVLKMRAEIAQYNHEFANALGFLDKATALAKDDRQAWLAVASINLVMGRYSESAAACERILGQHPVKVGCRSAVRAMRGEPKAAYAELLATLEANAVGSEASWLLGILGDLSSLLGDDESAVRHYELALRVNPADRYARIAIVDGLSRLGRGTEALRLIEKGDDDTPSLVRSAILSPSKRPELASELERRFAIDRERDDWGHAREEALFLLRVVGDAKQAVEVALRNFERQKEIIDVRLLAEAAAAASHAGACKEARRWIQQSGYTDAQLGQFGQCLARGVL